MLIKFKMGWLTTSNARSQWLLMEAVRQLQLLEAEKATTAGTESNKINELPDRGSNNETKTVTDPHSKPVQE